MFALDTQEVSYRFRERFAVTKIGNNLAQILIVFVGEWLLIPCLAGSEKPDGVPFLPANIS